MTLGTQTTGIGRFKSAVLMMSMNGSRRLGSSEGRVDQIQKPKVVIQLVPFF